MSSPIELLLEHFSVSTILAIIVLTHIDSPSITLIGSVFVLVLVVVILFCTHYTEYDIYNYMNNKSLNYKLMPIIFSVIIIGLCTLFFYENEYISTFKVSMIAFVWNLVLSIIWLILKYKRKNRKID